MISFGTSSFRLLFKGKNLMIIITLKKEDPLIKERLPALDYSNIVSQGWNGTIAGHKQYPMRKIKEIGLRLKTYMKKDGGSTRIFTIITLILTINL